jgi:arginyl-tRNA synthetase
MAKSYTEFTYNTSMPRLQKKYDSVYTAQRLMEAMQVAIENMIHEIQKPVDQELSGSQRKAELQSIKQTAVDAKELIVERERLEQLIKTLKDNGELQEQRDYSGGFAEQFSK